MTCRCAHARRLQSCCPPCFVEFGSALFILVDATHTVLAVLSELQRGRSRIGFYVCSAFVRRLLKPFDEELMSLKRRCCLLSRRPHCAAFCGPAESTGQRNFLKMTYRHLSEKGCLPSCRATGGSAGSKGNFHPVLTLNVISLV